jgi:hypothetical protein
VFPHDLPTWALPWASASTAQEHYPQEKRFSSERAIPEYQKKKPRLVFNILWAVKAAGENGRWANVVGGELKHGKYHARIAQLRASTGMGIQRKFSIAICIWIETTPHDNFSEYSFPALIKKSYQELSSFATTPSTNKTKDILHQDASPTSDSSPFQPHSRIHCQ